MDEYQSIFKQLIKLFHEGFGLIDLFKSADFDEICLFLAVPKYQNGIGVKNKNKCIY